MARRYLAIILVSLLALPPFARAEESDLAAEMIGSSITAASGAVAVRQADQLKADWRLLLPAEHRSVAEARKALAQAEARNSGVKEANGSLAKKVAGLKRAKRDALKRRFEIEHHDRLQAKIKARRFTRNLSFLSALGAAIFTARSALGPSNAAEPTVIENMNYAPKRPAAATIADVWLERYDAGRDVGTAK